MAEFRGLHLLARIARPGPARRELRAYGMKLGPLWLTLLSALLVPGSLSVARHQPGEPRRVLLWTSHPCTTHWPWPTKCNSTMLASFLQYLAPLRGVVDRVAVNGYYLADPNGSDVAQSGGVVRLGEDLSAIVAALQQAGFEVEPLVGNGPPMRYPPPGSLPQQVGSSIDRFRPYLRPALRAGLASTVSDTVLSLPRSCCIVASCFCLLAPARNDAAPAGPVERRAGEFRGLVALALEIFGEDGGPLRGERGGVGERRAVAS